MIFRSYEFANAKMSKCTVQISVQDKQDNIKKLTATGSFKLSWLNELAETETDNSGILQQV